MSKQGDETSTTEMDPIRLDSISNDSQLEDLDTDALMQLLSSNEQITFPLPSEMKRATGHEIQTLLTDDMHYLCTCSNFYPLDKTDFEIFAEQHLTHLMEQLEQQCDGGVRPLVPSIMENAHQQARRVKGNVHARFRIWKPIIPAKTSVKKDTWQATDFEDVTDKDGLSGVLEGAVRTLRDRAKKKLQARRAELRASGNTDEPPAVKRKRPENVTSTLTTNSVGTSGTSTSESYHGTTIDLEDDPDSLLSIARAVVQPFVEEYDKDEFQDRLDRLYQDFADHNNGGDYKEWAKLLYKVLRENPNDPRAKALNRDRKACLKLVYNLVNAWDNWVKEEGRPSPTFEQAICQVFQFRRFKRIFAVCLVMDRAQCLYLMRDLSLPAEDAPSGMPWYSSLHLRNDTVFANNYKSLMMEFQTYLQNYTGYLGDGGSTMNKRLFRILFLESLGFQKDPYFRELSMPAERPEDADEMLS